MTFQQPAVNGPAKNHSESLAVESLADSLVPQGDMGSVFIARRAGTEQAASATMIRIIGTDAKVSGSVALTPNSRFDIRRVSPNDAAKPITTPVAASRMPSPTTILSTCCRCAPSAMRMPISWVRCATTQESTP